MPLGLLYIATVLRVKGYTVAIIDCHANSYTKADVLRLISEHQPRLVGVNITTPNRRVVFDLVRAIKSAFEDTPVIVGGPHATSLPEDIHAHVIVDGVVVGEGEMTVLRIVEALPEIPSIQGVYTREDFLQGRPKIYSTRLEDLDALPYPDFDLLDVDKYLSVSRELYITCSRGCLYDCAFCSIRSLLGRGVTERSAGNVLDEMRRLQERYGVEKFYFYDDDFMLWKNWQEFCSLATGMGLSWTAQGTLNDIKDEAEARAMAAAGCYRLSFGFESGSYRLQKYIAKVIKDRSLALLPLFRDLSVQTRGYFIFGFPQEELEDVVETLLYLLKLRSLGLGDIAVFPARPYPGTRLFKACVERFGIEKADELLDFFYVDDWELRDDEILREKLRRYNTLPSFQINPIFTPQQTRELIVLANEVFFHPDHYASLGKDEMLGVVKDRLDAVLCQSSS
jgi:anaerobic magnesium-protoporphyrin IX monomethyl ester cyclase